MSDTETYRIHEIVNAKKTRLHDILSRAKNNKIMWLTKHKKKSSPISHGNTVHNKTKGFN